MPFVCKAIILPGLLRENHIVFDEWIDDAWSRSHVEKGTAFARGHDSKGSCIIVLNGPGGLSKRPLFVAGSEITEGTLVAEFITDGGLIPYGKPFCLGLYDDQPTSLARLG